mmetsp:Transcript_11033/g.18446  ORF Transcript_11033/g.18446 Transcript_11033/m.18446 type:complete len:104 (-) Transcript_11033:426-737(-)
MIQKQNAAVFKSIDLNFEKQFDAPMPDSAGTKAPKKGDGCKACKNKQKREQEPVDLTKGIKIKDDEKEQFNKDVKNVKNDFFRLGDSIKRLFGTTADITTRES